MNREVAAPQPTSPQPPSPASARPVELLVAGTGGGVGTTTVTGLLFATLSDRPAGPPELRDRSSGELGRRLAEGDDVPVLDRGLCLSDRGAHARRCGLEAAPSDVVILCAPATPLGAADAGRVLDAIEERHGSARLRRVIVVLVAAFGRHRLSLEVAGLREKVGTRSVVVFPCDLALATGGRIPLARLSIHTERAQRQLIAVLLERLRTRSS